MRNRAIAVSAAFLICALGIVPPAAADEQDRQPRPIPQGVSCGPTPSTPFIFAGTCGARVRSFFAPNQPFLLGNNHVFASIGDPANNIICPNTAPIGTWLLQQGTLDIGFDPGNNPFWIAGVLAGYIPIDFSPGASNRVDAALAFTTPELAATEILNIGEPVEQVGVALPGMSVKKNGRTTSLTFGTVEAINVTSTVNYGGGCGSARFVGQVSISPGSFSDAGDSGSLILNGDSVPVGLLFAGSGLRTLANQILTVYLTLGVFIEGEDPPSDSASVADAGALAQAAQRNVNPEIERLKAVQARNESQVFNNPDVTGVGIGLDATGNRLALVVYAKNGMGARARRALPRSIEGVGLRVIETEEFVAY